MPTKDMHKADLLSSIQTACYKIINERGLSIHERARLLEILRDLYYAESHHKPLEAKCLYGELEDLLETLELREDLRRLLGLNQSEQTAA